MATYAVGDIHGCSKSFEALLAQLPLDPARDRLWLTGDLVNRGPASLAVLRTASALEKTLGKRLVAVLGNHDVYLLARARGAAPRRQGDTLDEVLRAPDREALLAWLGSRPLLHRRGRYVLVHAGLLPEWAPLDAERWARAVEQALQGPDAAEVLAKSPRAAQAALDPLRRALQAFTLLRTLDEDGELFRYAGPPEKAPAGTVPWFEAPGRRSAGSTVVCGHWAAMGLRLEGNLLALDTGCAWGGSLTALRLEDRELFQQPCVDALEGMDEMERGKD